MIDLTLQMCWTGGTSFNVCFMVWKPIKEGLKQLGGTIPQERLWPGKCCTSPDCSQERVATHTPSTHVIEQSMHLRSRQCCHFDVEVVNKVGNGFDDIGLDFDYTFMDGHLQVTAENFDELFKTEANIAIREVQQCSSPSFIWVVCSQLTFKMTNHCNKSRSGVPVKHLENPGHGPVNLQLVLCYLCNNLVRCKLPRLQLEVFFPSAPSTWRI